MANKSLDDKISDLEQKIVKLETIVNLTLKELVDDKLEYKELLKKFDIIIDNLSIFVTNLDTKMQCIITEKNLTEKHLKYAISLIFSIFGLILGYIGLK